MMTAQANNIDFKSLVGKFSRQFMVWVPIIIGLIQQYRLNILGARGTYVILDPPGYIYPYATLESNWWLILTILTSVLCVLTYTNRLRPSRMFLPFYLYLLYLLIFIQPI
jgi:hypothetical protein